MTTPGQTLQTLARLDPDYPAFAAALPQETLLEAGARLPDGLAEDVTAIIKAERPELSDWLDAQPSSLPPDKMAVDPLAAAGVLTAVLFLLRTHIRIKRDSNGKWSFLLEHKPMENDLLRNVFDKISSFIGGKL